MKKKPWGRLGAAISAVALLAVGLVGVAAPAQATGHGDREKCATYQNNDPDWNAARAQVTSECEAKGYTEIITGVVMNGTGDYYACPTGAAPTYCYGYGYPGEPEQNEPVQKTTPPPPCWDASINNCPVGGALTFCGAEVRDGGSCR